MQVEHVCTHFKAHSQTSDVFQASIGKPQLGKVSLTPYHVSCTDAGYTAALC